MDTVEKIEAEIQQLPEPDLKRLSTWFEEFMADEWDRQIERDAKAGKLDALAEEAKRDYEAGHCTPL